MDNLERYFTHLCKEKAEKNNGVLKIHKVQMCTLTLVSVYNLMTCRTTLLLRTLWRENMTRWR